MNTNGQNRTIGFGLLVIVIGFMILLHQLQMIPEQLDHVIISWQMFLIVFGVYNLFFTQSRVFGYILISVGGFFIIPEIFITLTYSRKFYRTEYLYSTSRSQIFETPCKYSRLLIKTDDNHNILFLIYPSNDE